MELVDVLRGRIVSGAIAPDAGVKQDALAAELGISKIPLREALCRLEQDGLVRAVANRGFFAAPMTRADAEEIFALRIKLEPGVAARAAKRADDDERRLARALLARRGEDGEANRLFHLALIQPSGNALTVGIIERLQLLAERYVRKHLEPAGRRIRARREHAALLAAWLKRDGAGVAKLTRRHIAETLRDLKTQLG
jgi:DNA-binding GntR family transcriptional regulator